MIIAAYYFITADGCYFTFLYLALNNLDVLTAFCGRLAMLDEHRPPEMLRRGHYVNLK